MVSKPGSEMTSVKLPAWGAAIRKFPTPSDLVVPAIDPSVFTRSTSALGTIAPVGSATTPCTVVAGAGFELEFDELPARITAGDSSNITKAKKRSMRISNETQQRGPGKGLTLHLHLGAQIRFKTDDHCR